MTDLEKLKEAFEKWAKASENNQSGYVVAMPSCVQSPIDRRQAAELFWPFVEFYFKVQADKDRGLYADEIKILNNLKFKLGMQMMAHEFFGVER